MTMPADPAIEETPDVWEFAERVYREAGGPTPELQALHAEYLRWKASRNRPDELAAQPAERTAAEMRREVEE